MYHHPNNYNGKPQLSCILSVILILGVVFWITIIYMYSGMNLDYNNGGKGMELNKVLEQSLLDVSLKETKLNMFTRKIINVKLELDQVNKELTTNTERSRKLFDQLLDDHQQYLKSGDPKDDLMRKVFDLLDWDTVRKHRGTQNNLVQRLEELHLQLSNDADSLITDSKRGVNALSNNVEKLLGNTRNTSSPSYEILKDAAKFIRNNQKDLSMNRNNANKAEDGKITQLVQRIQDLIEQKRNWVRRTELQTNAIDVKDSILDLANKHTLLDNTNSSGSYNETETLQFKLKQKQEEIKEQRYYWKTIRDTLTPHLHREVDKITKEEVKSYDYLGCITYKVGPSLEDWLDLNESLKTLHYIDPQQKYPVFIFHEAYVKDGFIGQNTQHPTENQLTESAQQGGQPSSKPRILKLSKQYLKLPEYILNRTNVVKPFCVDTRGEWKQCFDIGFRLMGQFRTQNVHMDPLIHNKCKYFMSLDTDFKFVDNVKIDIFKEMDKSKSDFGYWIVDGDEYAYVKGLCETTLGYLKTMNITDNHLNKFFKFKTNERGERVCDPPYTLRTYLGCFNIYSTQFFSSEQYLHLVRYLDIMPPQGIYTHRWGEQSIFPLALAIHSSLNKIRFFGLELNAQHGDVKTHNAQKFARNGKDSDWSLTNPPSKLE